MDNSIIPAGEIPLFQEELKQLTDLTQLFLRDVFSSPPENELKKIVSCLTNLRELKQLHIGGVFSTQFSTDDFVNSLSPLSKLTCLDSLSFIESRNTFYFLNPTIYTKLRGLYTLFTSQRDKKRGQFQMPLLISAPPPPAGHLVPQHLFPPHLPLLAAAPVVQQLTEEERQQLTTYNQAMEDVRGLITEIKDQKKEFKKNFQSDEVYYKRLATLMKEIFAIKDMRKGSEDFRKAEKIKRGRMIVAFKKITSLTLKEVEAYLGYGSSITSGLGHSDPFRAQQEDEWLGLAADVLVKRGEEERENLQKVLEELKKESIAKDL